MAQFLTYKQAGVDRDAGNDVVEFLRQRLPHIGGFSGLYPFPVAAYQEPILVSAADGVGTKLMIASQADDFNGVGIDLVAMVCNDIVTCGAEPLFFLDYIGAEKLRRKQTEQLLESVMAGCQRAGCQLLGGETAQLPGFYREGNVELVGFAVGVVEKSRVINGAHIKAGDAVIGVPASGLHSNGFSLARKILFDLHSYKLETRPEWLDGRTLKEELLRPTIIYAPLIKELLHSKRQLKGIAHITGGGIPDNLSRILPPSCAASIDSRLWKAPIIFEQLRQLGNVERKEMFRVFNMGIGLALVVAWEEMEPTLARVQKYYSGAARIGEIIAGERGVMIE